jgi:NAD(P)-dependent dehydrogenase (short-subunit alcohol dehydrogenase family)
LAAGGDLVLMGTRRMEICEGFAAQLRSDGAAAFAAHLDLADPISIDRFVESADYLIGSVDVLVSAAGLADGSWVGAQHLAAQVVPPMIERGSGEVVLISPELIGPSPATARRLLENWAAGLEAEFIGTGARVSIVRSADGGARPVTMRAAQRPEVGAPPACGGEAGNMQVPPGDIGCLIATMLDSPRMHLRVVDVIAPVPAASRSTPAR